MLNRVHLIGNLGSDPSTTTTQSGTNICKFSIATSKKWKDGSGNEQSRTEWHNIVCFAKLADICSQYLAKGKQVYVEGEINYNKYEKDGETKYFTQIIAQQVKFLGQRGECLSSSSSSNQEEIPF